MPCPDCNARSELEEIEKQAMVKRAPNPVDKHVGSRIRMRRLMLGMSQEKLADGLGLTFQQVQKYENGKNRIGAGRLQHISHILQIPVPFFFEGSPHGEASTPAHVSDFQSEYVKAGTRCYVCIVNDKKARRSVGAGS
jgi:ribosome-binding protein aMBF1 (putative translation factor)